MEKLQQHAQTVVNQKMYRKRNKLYEELKYKLNKQENYEIKNEWVETNIEKLMNYYKDFGYDEDTFNYFNLKKRLIKIEKRLSKKADQLK